MKKRLLNSFIIIVLLLTGGFIAFMRGVGGTALDPVISRILQIVRPYPKLENPKQVVLSCDYHGKNYSVSETMYGSLDQYYKTDPHKRQAYYGDNKGFVFNYKEDNSLDEIANKISSEGKNNGLTDDQILDLGACMIQNIPYDGAKAAKILGNDFQKYSYYEVVPRYPYETLYESSGLCTDKTFLGSALFERMGYETALLTFEKEKHMSLGIGVPSGYGTFGTDYGIMELTNSGFKVGDVPQVDVAAGSTSSVYQDFSEISTKILGGNDNEKKNIDLGNPSEIDSVSVGKKYLRIVDRKALKDKIDSASEALKETLPEVEKANNETDSFEKEVSQAYQTYLISKNKESYNNYQEIYASYKSKFLYAEEKVREYNTLVRGYNSLINQYRGF